LRGNRIEPTLLLAHHFCWHIIGEYPPQPGGVSDYTGRVAAGLAQQGDEVHVWCGPSPNPDSGPATPGVVVHRALGSFSPADLRSVGEQLDRFPAPRRILVQWVPHAYGYRSMNVGFCAWLRSRAARSGDQVDIMAHEPFLSFGRNYRQSAAALVHRLMTILLLRSAARVWISIPAWEGLLRPYALGRKIPFQWLPIPSNIPVAQNPSARENIRRLYAPDDTILIGHFGTHGWPVTPLLESILEMLGDVLPDARVLLMGIGSREFRAEMTEKRPQLTPMIHATGALPPEDLSAHVAECDLLVQPYPDGVSSRRTSVMLGLSHAKAVVTTAGELTEPLWSASNALALAPAGDTKAFVRLVEQLACDPAERRRMGQAARKLYQARFDLSITIGALREAAAMEYSECVS
jgi:glycosyltransferase involved in cell wall biosynthesis